MSHTDTIFQILFKFQKNVLLILYIVTYESTMINIRTSQAPTITNQMQNNLKKLYVTC